MIILAGEAGYDKLFLEMSEILTQAVSLYESAIFEHLDSPVMGIVR